MKEIWTKSWKKVLVWVCGYVGILAFAIAGGYVIVKSEDAELHRTAKQCFIVTLAFLAADALLAVLTYIDSLANAAAGYTVFLDWASFLLELAKIGVYATVIVMTLVNARGEEDAPPAEKADEAAAKPAQEENAAQK